MKLCHFNAGLDQPLFFNRGTMRYRIRINDTRCRRAIKRDDG